MFFVVFCCGFKIFDCHHSNWIRTTLVGAAAAAEQAPSQPASQPVTFLVQSVVLNSHVCGVGAKMKKEWRFPARSTQDDIFIDEPSRLPIVSEVSAARLFLFQSFLPSENHFVITIFVLAPAFPVEDSWEQVPLCTNASDGATSTGETLETAWLSCLSGGFLLCHRFSSLESCWATAGSLRNLQDADVSGKQIRAPVGLSFQALRRIVFNCIFFFFFIAVEPFTPEKSSAAKLSQSAVYRQSCSHLRQTGFTLPAQSKQTAHMMGTCVRHSRCLLLITLRLVRAAALIPLFSRNRCLSRALGWEPQSRVRVWGSIPLTSWPCHDFFQQY